MTKEKSRNPRRGKGVDQFATETETGYTDKTPVPTPQNAEASRYQMPVMSYERVCSKRNMNSNTNLFDLLVKRAESCTVILLL